MNRYPAPPAPRWEAVIDHRNVGAIVVRRGSDLRWLIEANPPGTRIRPVGIR